MDQLEKSHEETKIFCRLTPTLIQPAISAVKITYHIRNLLLCGPSKSTQLSYSLALVNRLIVLIGTPVCRAGDLKGDRMKAVELSGLEVGGIQKPEARRDTRDFRQSAQKEEKLMATTILGTAFHPLIAEPRPATMGRI